MCTFLEAFTQITLFFLKCLFFEVMESSYLSRF